LLLDFQIHVLVPDAPCCSDPSKQKDDLALLLQFPLQSLNFSLIIEIFKNTGDFESSHDGAAADKDFPFCQPLPVAWLAQLL
jgi:hypothetical protein